jgi:hypothetical protein
MDHSNSTYIWERSLYDFINDHCLWMRPRNINVHVVVGHVLQPQVVNCRSKQLPCQDTHLVSLEAHLKVRIRTK